MAISLFISFFAGNFGSNFIRKTNQLTGKSGRDLPNQMLTLALKGEAKALGTGLDGKTVIVTGQVIDYKGKPEIILTDKSLLKFQN